MRKKIFSLLVFCFMAVEQALASDVLTVAAVTVPQGSEATLEVGCQFDTQFKAFQFDVELPNGLSLVVNENGKPECEVGFEGSDHTVSASTVATGKYRFVCTSTSNALLPMSGTLLKVKVTGGETVAIGDSFEGKVTNTEFTTVNYDVTNLEDVTFVITIGEAPDTHIILDETSTTAPEAATGVDVRVLRTIKANEWSTLCLPFDLTAAQVKAAFGDDMQLADFTGCDVDDTTGDIQVHFSNVTAIEANHPYIIKVSASVTEFTVDGVDIVPEDEPSINKDKSGRRYNSFIGTYVANTVVPDHCLFLSDNQFWFSTGKTKTKAFRAYFDLDAAGAEYDDAEVAARITMAFDEGETTGIRNLTPALSEGEGVYYNLKGQQVAAPSKGLYIKDGKKMVVK